MAYLKQVAIAVDQLFNALLGGWADETLSARCWRLHQRYIIAMIGVRLIDTLFFFEKDHCENSYYSERERLHIAPEYRD